MCVGETNLKVQGRGYQVRLGSYPFADSRNFLMGEGKTLLDVGVKDGARIVFFPEGLRGGALPETIDMPFPSHERASRMSVREALGLASRYFHLFYTQHYNPTDYESKSGQLDEQQEVRDERLQAIQEELETAVYVEGRGATRRKKRQQKLQNIKHLLSSKITQRNKLASEIEKLAMTVDALEEEIKEDDIVAVEDEEYKKVCYFVC